MRFLGDMGVSWRVIEWLRSRPRRGSPPRRGLAATAEWRHLPEGLRRAADRADVRPRFRRNPRGFGRAGCKRRPLPSPRHANGTRHPTPPNRAGPVERRTAGRGYRRGGGRPPPRPQITHRKLKARHLCRNGISPSCVRHPCRIGSQPEFLVDPSERAFSVARCGTVVPDWSVVGGQWLVVGTKGPKTHNATTSLAVNQK